MKQDRRRFLKSLGILSAAGPLPAQVVVTELPATPAAVEPSSEGGDDPPRSFAYLTPPEIAFVEAALSRLIPKDELGPGAKEAGVAVFIDRQLAGAFGSQARGYRQGPWAEGTPQQGWQSRLTPQDVYRVAIAEADRHCQSRYGKPFAQLAAPDQDEVLRGLEGGSLALPSVKAPLFFELLWQNTQEGFFADPIHGGNRDKAGWRLVGFPGVAAVYTGHIEKHGVPYRPEPVSIADLQHKRVPTDEHGHPRHEIPGGRD